MNIIESKNTIKKYFKYKKNVLTLLNNQIDEFYKLKEKNILEKTHYAIGDDVIFDNKTLIHGTRLPVNELNIIKENGLVAPEFIKVIDIDKKTGEILKTDKLVVFLDKKLKKYKETIGFYSIVTSEVDTDDKEIINKYHGLSRIEDSFRIIKSDLEGRPIYVWSKEHINAHFLVCFIALTIIRIMQYKVLKYRKKPTLNVDGWEEGITAEKLKEELNKFQVDKLPSNYFKISKISDSVNEIMKSLNIDFQFKEYNLKEIKKFRELINQ